MKSSHRTADIEVSSRPCRSLRRRTSRLSDYILGFDGAFEREPREAIPIVDVPAVWNGRQAMWVSWEGIFGLRPRAHTDPARLEAG